MRIRNRKIRQMNSASLAGLMFSRLERRQLLAGDVTFSASDFALVASTSQRLESREVHVSCEVANGEDTTDGDVQPDCISLVSGTVDVGSTTDGANLFAVGDSNRVTFSMSDDLDQRPEQPVEPSQTPTSALEPITLSPPQESVASPAPHAEAPVEVQRGIYFSKDSVAERTAVEPTGKSAAFASELLESRQVFAIAELALATPDFQIQDFQASVNAEGSLSQSSRHFDRSSSSTIESFLDSSISQRSRSDSSLGLSDGFQTSSIPTALSGSTNQFSEASDVEADLYFGDFESEDLLLLDDVGIASTDLKRDGEAGGEDVLENAAGSKIAFVRERRVKAPKETKVAPLVESFLLVAMLGTGPAKRRSTEIGTCQVAVVPNTPD